MRGFDFGPEAFTTLIVWRERESGYPAGLMLSNFTVLGSAILAQKGASMFTHTHAHVYGFVCMRACPGGLPGAAYEGRSPSQGQNWGLVLRLPLARNEAPPSRHGS